MLDRVFFKFAKKTALAVGLASATLASAQTYRQNYPMPDGTDFSGLGVCIILHSPSDAQVKKVADAGIKFVRYDFTWSGIEKVKGVYDWREIDQAMAKFRANNIRVMGLLAYGNTLYSSTGTPNTPESRAAYARFAAAAAARYKEQGVVWEIYNEPEIAFWWNNPNAADYAALVAEASNAIRAVSPNEWIVGLSTMTPYEGNLAYVTAALDAGMLNYVDGLSPHPYSMNTPESMMGSWSTLRNLVDNRRGNRSISLQAGEVGFSRTWAGGNLALQASITTRTVLTNMIQGVGITNLYEYMDEPGDQSDWKNTSGLVARDANETPYPVYYALQRMTSTLKNYKFTKRLTLASANDYAMLFSNPSNPSDCRVVVWTTDATHNVSLPSSAVTFSRLALATAATGTVTASGGKVVVSATTEPTIYSGQSANPALAVVSQWAKLPATVKVADRNDAVSQLGALVASPAWASAPAGTTLKIEDIPTAVPGYVRPSYTTTLTNLPSVTVGSAAFETVFNSLGLLQDTADQARVLTFTLTFPDGSTAIQRASVGRIQPMALFPTMPSGWSLSLRLENPTGKAFTGTVKANSGTVTVPVSVNFAAGQTFQQINFPTLNQNLLASGVAYSLFDDNGNVLVPSSPAIASTNTTVYRAPNLANGTGYSVSVRGNASVSASATLSYATCGWSFLTGAQQGNIDYRFAAGASRFVTVNPPANVTGTTFAKTPVSVGMWVFGDNSRNTIRCQLLDSSNQTFLATYGEINWTGWKWVSIPIQGNLTQWWSGANDGVVHGAMRVIYPFILDSNNLGSTGRISVMGPTVVGQKEAGSRQSTEAARGISPAPLSFWDWGRR